MDYPFIGHKCRGRLIVENEKIKNQVLTFLNELDPYEEEYARKDFISFEKDCDTIYMGKYEPDMEALWNWAKDKNISLTYIYEDQDYSNRQVFHINSNEKSNEKELLECLENLYNKVTNIRGVDIENIYAVEECEKAKMLIEKLKNF